MPPIQRILCPVDFSESSVLAYHYAESIAWHYSATVLLQHVIDSPTPYYPYYAYPDTYVESAEQFALTLCSSFRSLPKHIIAGAYESNTPCQMAL